MNSYQDLDSLVVSHDTFENVIRFKHEVLLDINEHIISSDSDIVKDSLTTLGQELYHHLEFYQKVVINFLYFKDSKILINYIEWIYRLFHHKNVDIEFFKTLNQYWIESFSKYLKSINQLEITNIYKFLIENHKAIERKSLVKYTENNKEIEEVYSLLIASKKSEVFSFCKRNIDSLDDFISYFDTVLTPTLHKVGSMWERSEISVAKEHIASTIIEEFTLDLLSEFEPQEDNGKTILLANAPNEYHGMGLIIISKVLKLLGYEVVSLGKSGTPADSILTIIDEIKPDYVMFGVSLSINLYDVALLIKKIKIERHNIDLKIIIGGNAFNNIDNPEKKLDVNKYLQDLNSVKQFFIK